MAESTLATHFPIYSRNKQMEADKMSTASSTGAAERRPLMQALVVERRTLFACTVLVGLCTFIWIAAVCTEQWVHIDGGDGIYLPKTNRYFYYGTSGLWQTCRQVWPPPVPKLNATTAPMVALLPQLNMTGLKSAAKNATIPVPTRPPIPEKPADISKVTLFRKCTNYLADELANSTNKDPAYNSEISSYSRTMVSFAIISLFVMAMGCGFSAYTFLNPRYMFKRLAAGIHFISTSCTLVSGQIMMTTVEYFSKNIELVYPIGAKHYYGVSWYLGWFVVLVNMSAAFAFLWYSRKRKGDKAATDELAMADEPTIIGR